jgi:hypothetical protein
MKDNPKHVQAMKDGKDPMEFIPWEVLGGVARVLRSGAIKYGVRNWIIDKIKATTYVAAIIRHTIEWACGSSADKDSGEHPLDHVIATCMVVRSAEMGGTLIDDRMTAESKGDDPRKDRSTTTRAADEPKLSPAGFNLSAFDEALPRVPKINPIGYFPDEGHSFVWSGDKDAM